MDKQRPYTYDQPGQVANDRVTPRFVPDLTSRRRDEVSPPPPVSMSSDLHEKDCRYRGGARIDAGGELLRVAAHHILQADEAMRKAAAEGASPMALAAIEQLGLTYSAGAGRLIASYLDRPHERW
jgi:hypothetical protein